MSALYSGEYDDIVTKYRSKQKLNEFRAKIVYTCEVKNYQYFICKLLDNSDFFVASLQVLLHLVCVVRYETARACVSKL